MAVAASDPYRFARSVVAITPLILEHAAGRSPVIHAVPLGTRFPDGSEALAGRILDEFGHAYLFETRWDDERDRVVLSTWQQVAPVISCQPSVLSSGLPITDN